MSIGKHRMQELPVMTHDVFSDSQTAGAGKLVATNSRIKRYCIFCIKRHKKVDQILIAFHGRNMVKHEAYIATTVC